MTHPTTDKEALYLGKNVNDMTKKELIAALIDTSLLYEQHIHETIKTLDEVKTWKRKSWWKL